MLHPTVYTNCQSNRIQERRRDQTRKASTNSTRGGQQIAPLKSQQNLACLWPRPPLAWPSHKPWKVSRCTQSTLISHSRPQWRTQLSLLKHKSWGHHSQADVSLVQRRPPQQRSTPEKKSGRPAPHCPLAAFLQIGSGYCMQRLARTGRQAGKARQGKTGRQAGTQARHRIGR